MRYTVQSRRRISRSDDETIETTERADLTPELISQTQKHVIDSKLLILMSDRVIEVITYKQCR